MLPCRDITCYKTAIFIISDTTLVTSAVTRLDVRSVGHVVGAGAGRRGHGGAGGVRQPARVLAAAPARLRHHPAPRRGTAQAATR